jgi:DMSO reductase anchor subunit
LVALATGVVALGASVFHLGRPQYAYRALIGLRHSWLSREVAAFGAFTGAVAGYAVTGSRPLAAVAVVAGLAGIACSVMIYAKANRSWWRVAITGPKFALTMAIAALAVRMPLAGALVLALKLLAEATVWASPVTDVDLRTPSRWRFAVGLLGVAALTLAAIAPILLGPALVIVAIGEYLERSLFFTAAPRPG